MQRCRGRNQRRATRSDGYLVPEREPRRTRRNEQIRQPEGLPRSGTVVSLRAAFGASAPFGLAPALWRREEEGDGEGGEEEEKEK